MAPGRIVILNGAPRSGKSTIAAALQQTLPGNWINLGVDGQSRSLPERLMPGIGLRPGGERPDLEPMVVALYGALYQSVAVYALQGFDVVVDVGHHDSYSRPLGILPACARLLAGLEVLFVGVRCSTAVITARRAADQRDGFYSIDPERIERWQDAVHHIAYDVEVDTGAQPVAKSVAIIAVALAEPARPSAFAQMLSDPAPSELAGDRA